ncbi:MAG TPA: tRNA dihydrouridine synthase DusB [bacterium]
MKSRYRSEINQDVALAQPGEFSPIAIGPLRVWPPVVLAPMAGITNSPFRRLCKKFGAGLYVCEMVAARGLVTGNPKALKLAAFAPDEMPRSLQLCGVDPHFIGEAVSRLVNDSHVDHIDMNFGCPVRKVTRNGGGAAIPVKPNLLRNIIRAAVRHAGAVPVTIKFRIGINDELQTYLTAGRIAEEEGCAAVALHARTAAQLYDGEANWDYIAKLKAAVRTIPVLGNGDIWEACDALRMARATGCDGVVIGRGCLGRPWLFRDLADVFNGREPQPPPHLGEIVDIMLEHARLLRDWLEERKAMITFRKHSTWYLKDFTSTKALREQLIRTHTFAEFEELLNRVDREEPFPPHRLRVSRGKRPGTQNVALPRGYLDDLGDDTPPGIEAEEEISGG